MNAMLNPIFREILNGSLPMPEEAEMRITKKKYKAEDVYKGSGRVFGVFNSYNEAFNRVTYSRVIESEPKAWFSRITVMESEAVGKNGDTLTWGESKIVEIINLV